MRFVWLLALGACAASAPVRRVVIAPEDSLPDQAKCQERCAAHVHDGEQVRCEHVSLYDKYEASLGYRTAIVCVIQPREVH